MSSKAAAPHKKQRKERVQAQPREPDSDEEPSSREHHADGEGSGSDGEGGPAPPRKGFLEGGKSAAFARAFAKLVGTAPLAPGEPREDGQQAPVLQAPILQGSKSVAKRQVAEAEEAERGNEAKRLRLEMRQRGHVVPTRRGEDPAADGREKALQRTATRGVVQLFNAISRAQRQARDAEAAGAEAGAAARLGRVGLLAELRAAGGKKPRGAERKKAAVAAVAGPAGGDSGNESDHPGWDVLQGGFAGLQGGGKMKDWDKEQDVGGAAGAGEELADADDSGGDEW